MIELYQQLIATPELIAAAGSFEIGDVRGVASLRKRWPKELVAAALDLTAARRGAAIKFPQHAATMVADVSGMEQATSAPVADHKAKRFAALKPARPIMDLCCGIGGDAMSLAPLGVIGVDRDPLRAWMCAKNAGCPTVAADVADLPLHDQVFHLDPQRRDTQGRKHRYEDYQPGPAFIASLIERCPAGAVKLGPGVELDCLPDGEIELIAEHGTLVQAVLWVGGLRGTEPRTATLLPEGVSLSGKPQGAEVGDVQRYVYAVSPTLERAELMWMLDLPTIHPALGLLTSEERATSPWLTPFEVIAEMPWRLNKVQAWLRDHHAGIVEVKTRGKAVDTDKTQAALRGRGDTPFTVFVLRMDRQVNALIATRL